MPPASSGGSSTRFCSAGRRGRWPRWINEPDDAAKALARAKLRKQFDALPFTHQKEHVRAIEEAKKPETRAKRIEAMVEKLRVG